MKISRFALVPLVLMTMLRLGRAAEQPLYDEKADAQQQVAAALGQASRTAKNVILIFGANW